MSENGNQYAGKGPGVGSIPIKRPKRSPTTEELTAAGAPPGPSHLAPPRVGRVKAPPGALDQRDRPGPGRDYCPEMPGGICSKDVEGLATRLAEERMRDEWLWGKPFSYWIGVGFAIAFLILCAVMVYQLGTAPIGE